MQTGKSVYKEIEDLLEGVELPRFALVEQSIDTLAKLPDIGEGVREALRQIGLPGLASGGDLFYTSLQHLQGSLQLLVGYASGTVCRWWYERRIAFVNGDKRSALLSQVSLLSAATALGTNPVAVKYAVGDIPPLPFVALRFTWAGLVVMAFLLFLGSGVRLKRQHVLPMASLGLIGVGLHNVMFTFGVALTSASNTALVYATPPLWGMLVGFALGLERPRMRGVLGILLAIFGVGIIVYGGWVAGACGATFWSRGRRSAGAPTRPSLSFCSATTRHSRSPATRCYSRAWPCYLSPLWTWYGRIGEP